MAVAYWLQNGVLAQGDLARALPFLGEKGHVTALVGAGGKTTLLYALAEHFCRLGHRTAVTTTTHIFRPEKNVCRTLADCRARWAAGTYAVWGSDAPDGKLSALPGSDFADLLAHADRVLVEADGARRMACKVPAAHEPVIPPQADTVLGVVGLDVLGRTVEAACFRPQQAMALLGCRPGHALTVADLAVILQSENGTRKDVGSRQYVMVLNKADTPTRRAQGEQLLRCLHGRAVMTCFLEETT